MNRLKNITRSLVIVPDAKLRLAPGESAEVAELTPQCLAALRNGCVAKVDPPKVAEEPADEELPTPVSDARPAAVASEPANRGGKKERREAKEPQGEDVLDAMKARLAEASSAGS
jgi:hypothetical protein